MKILIVDDNKDNLYQLQTLLSGNGFTVMSAAHGAEALEKAHADTPDLVISDILMPVMDGFTLCRNWMRDDLLRAIPFVFYTATYTDDSDRDFALSLGARRFIIKPEEPNAFVQAIQQVIRRAAEETQPVPPPARGAQPAIHVPVHQEVVYLKEYNDVLIRKLESKVFQLEQARNDLECDIAERKRVEAELALANRIAQVFLCATDEEMYGQVLEIVRQEMESPHGLFGYIAENGDLVIPSMTREIWEQCQVPDKTVVFPPDTWGDTLWGKAIRERRSYHDNREFKVPEGHIPVDSFLTVPVVFQDRTIGLLSVGNRPGGYTDEHQRLLEGVAGFISPILHARQQRDLHEAERKRAEEEKEKLQANLVHMQKIESVGRLAGGVAHDFNNMLSVILGHVDLVLANLDESSPLHANMTEIRSATQRSADLTRQLLAFARRQTVQPKVVDLNDVIEGMLKMLRRLIGEEVEVVWTPGRQLGQVKIDPAQVDQMLANLIVNARDAMAGGTGRVTIDTENVTIDEAYCALHPDCSPGMYVVLSVSDTGCGMDTDVLSHIFEPFFTTKGVGWGTGLGLATVYGIIKQNDGFISVYSEVGHGTTFRLHLPRQLGEGESKPETGVARKMTGGTETVLVVEDEPMISGITRKLLNGLGYTVLVTNSPQDALRVAKEHAYNIDLVVTDVVMPGMNGRELTDHLSAHHPEMKCLYVSGYPADLIAHRGMLDPGVHFLQKPFSMERLASKVREALEA
jgi:signal transduction histidine kinase/DNA-binding response OmpR family regulator